MNEAREKELVELLNKYDTSGVPFYKAKQEILAKGFTEAELVYGLYSAPFDGKVNEPRPVNPMQKFYQENPEKADKLAKKLFLVQAEGDWDKVAANAAASQFGVGIQARSYYDLKLADQLGIPYFTLMLLGLILLAVLIKLNLPEQTAYTILFIYSISINGFYGYKLFRERQRVSKLRKELRNDRAN